MFILNNVRSYSRNTRHLFIVAALAWFFLGVGSNLMTMYLQVLSGSHTALSFIGLIGCTITILLLEQADRAYAMKNIMLAAERNSAAPRPKAVHDLVSLRQLSWHFELSL